MTAWPARAEPVDLELLLAIDASLSVDEGEFALQMGGLARAFRDPRVAAAIRAAGDLGIGVALVQWANSNQQDLAVGWSRVRDPASAESFAQGIEATGRHFVGAGTAIASALRFAIPLFDGNGFEGRRKVIDVSGDGSDNRGPAPEQFRDLAVLRGITINGLAIVNEDPFLQLYYAQRLIGGTGAFVVVAQDYRDFQDAIVLKLVREIVAAPVAALPLQRAAAEPCVPALNPVSRLPARC